MKHSIQIVIAAFAISLVSCTAVTDTYAYNDPYSMGYSDGYRDGYYRSPDGFWYAPNAIYLDNNGSYYRNGAVYNSRSRVRNNVIISPKRNSLHNQNIRVQPNRTQRNSGMIQRNQQNVNTQPAKRLPNNNRAIPQQAKQPKKEVRSAENNGKR